MRTLASLIVLRLPARGHATRRCTPFAANGFHMILRAPTLRVPQRAIPQAGRSLGPVRCRRTLRLKLQSEDRFEHSAPRRPEEAVVARLAIDPAG